MKRYFLQKEKRSLCLPGFLLLAALVLAACDRVNPRQILLGDISATPVALGAGKASGPEAGVVVGDHVVVEVSGRVEGELQDQEPDRPRTADFVVGEQETFPALERAVIGMQVDETKRIKVPAAEAFGPRYQGLEMPMPRSVIPPGMHPIVGDVIRLQGPDGQLTPCTVVAITGDSLWVDMNHPLAGKDLVLDIRVAAID